jgi:hypothetical protein
MPSALRLVRRGETFADAGPLSRASLQAEMDRRKAAADTAKSALASKEAGWAPQLSAYSAYVDTILSRNPSLPTQCADDYFCVGSGPAMADLWDTLPGPVTDRYVTVDRVLRPSVSDDQRMRDPIFWAVQAKGSGVNFDPRTKLPTYAQDMAASQTALDSANSALQVVMKQWADGEAEEAAKLRLAAKAAADAAAEKKRQADLAAKQAAELAAAAKKKADEDSATQQKVILGVAAIAGLYVLSKRR